jgi:signal peptidase
VTRRIVGRAVSALSATVLVAVALAIRPSAWPVGVVLWLAAAWGALPVIVLGVVGRRPTFVHPSRPGTVTTIIHLGAEPPDVARASIMAAASAGPVHVVATDPKAVAEHGSADIPVTVASTVGAGIITAAHAVETDTVLVLAAGSFPDAAAVARAAGLVHDDVGWVHGLVRPFNRNGYAPTGRDRLGQRLRESARRRGADLWEPDATVVSTALLRLAAAPEQRPWGAWLRSWRELGYRGVEVESTLAVWSVPVTPEWYWHRSVLRRRASIADLADSLSSHRGRAASGALLVHELFGISLTLWLVAPVLLAATSAQPFRWNSWFVAALLGGAGVMRWAAVRWLYGIPMHPLRDPLAAAYDAPGSVLGLPAAIRRRVVPTRVRLPRRPLVWVTATLALLLVAAVALDRQRPGGHVVAAMALFEIALVWLFAMHGILQLGWSRSTFRVRLRRPMVVNGGAAVATAGWPSGVTVRGGPGARIDERVDVRIHLRDGTNLATDAVVTSATRRGRDHLTDLAWELDPADVPRWIAELAEAAIDAGTHPRRRDTEPARARTAAAAFHRLLGAAITFAIGATALVAGATLIALILGYHPMVVRSGSMMPALGVGDVVLVRHIEADEVDVGDVATFDGPGGSITHRVVEVSRADAGLVVETRGDANLTSETWLIAPTDEVGVVTARVPRIGLAFAWLGGTPVRQHLLGVAFGLAALVIAWPLVRRRVIERRREPCPRNTTARSAL